MPAATVLAEPLPTLVPTARGVASVRSRNDLGSVPVGTQPSWDHEAFREFVIGRAKAMGIAESTASLGRESGIGRSMLSKWFSGVERPSPASLERLAKALNVDRLELLKRAGWIDGAAPTPAPPPVREPLVVELEQLLSDRAKLTPEEQDVLRDLVDRVLAGWRQQRNGRRRTA